MVFAAAHVFKGWTTQLGLFGGAQWATAANEGMFVSRLVIFVCDELYDDVPFRATMALDLESLRRWVLIVWTLNLSDTLFFGMALPQISAE